MAAFALFICLSPATSWCGYVRFFLICSSAATSGCGYVRPDPSNVFGIFDCCLLVRAAPSDQSSFVRFRLCRSVLSPAAAWHGHIRSFYLLVASHVLVWLRPLFVFACRQQRLGVATSALFVFCLFVCLHVHAAVGRRCPSASKHRAGALGSIECPLPFRLRRVRGGVGGSVAEAGACYDRPGLKQIFRGPHCICKLCLARSGIVCRMFL